MSRNTLLFQFYFPNKILLRASSGINLNTMVLKKKEVENGEDVQTGRKTNDNNKPKLTKNVERKDQRI